MSVLPTKPLKGLQRKKQNKKHQHSKNTYFDAGRLENDEVNVVREWRIWDLGNKRVKRQMPRYLLLK